MNRIASFGKVGTAVSLFRPLFFVLCTLYFSTQCAKLSPEEQAALAAEGYYRHLVAGEYEKFLEGRVGADSLPSDYRSQLIDGYRQFISQQQAAHQGIIDVSVTNVRTDSLDAYTSVFLLLCYGDSTQEEVIVPMVSLPDGRWRMR